MKKVRRDHGVLWHVYLDNYAGGQVVNVSESTVAGGQLHQLAERAWREAQVVSSKQNRKRAVDEAEELGALVSGATNAIGGSPNRVFKVLHATHWGVITAACVKEAGTSDCREVDTHFAI